MWKLLLCRYLAILYRTLFEKPVTSLCYVTENSLWETAKLIFAKAKICFAVPKPLRPAAEGGGLERFQKVYGRE